MGNNNFLNSLLRVISNLLRDFAALLNRTGEISFQKPRLSDQEDPEPKTWTTFEVVITWTTNMQPGSLNVLLDESADVSAQFQFSNTSERVASATITVMPGNHTLTATAGLETWSFWPFSAKKYELRTSSIQFTIWDFDVAISPSSTGYREDRMETLVSM